jgi:hypothetical protein
MFQYPMMRLWNALLSRNAQHCGFTPDKAFEGSKRMDGTSPGRDNHDRMPAPAVLVDFAPRAGLKEVSLNPQDLAARSAAALDSATAAIREVSEKVSAATQGLRHSPSGVEVEFGLQLEATGGAMIARAQAGVHITVTLKWERSDD